MYTVQCEKIGNVLLTIKQHCYFFFSPNWNLYLTSNTQTRTHNTQIQAVNVGFCPKARQSSNCKLPHSHTRKHKCIQNPTWQNHQFTVTKTDHIYRIVKKKNHIYKNNSLSNPNFFFLFSITTNEWESLPNYFFFLKKKWKITDSNKGN